MVTDIEILKEELKEKISEKRYMHSLGVMKMCEKLAQIYNSDIQKAKLVGLMHDIAKEMSKEEKIEYVNKNNIYYSETEKNNVEILHGKIAGDICKKKYDFDEEMCIAIAFHTTGKENMTLLQKILFVADKCDETRNYQLAEEIREKSYTDLDKAILMNINYELKKNIEENKVIVEKSIETRNYILINLGMGDGSKIPKN